MRSLKTWLGCSLASMVVFAGTAALAQEIQVDFEKSEYFVSEADASAEVVLRKVGIRSPAIYVEYKKQYFNNVQAGNIDIPQNNQNSTQLLEVDLPPGLNNAYVDTRARSVVLTITNLTPYKYTKGQTIVLGPNVTTTIHIQDDD